MADHLGPVSTYMTSCHGDCRVFHVNGAKWFKIDAAGYSHGRWASARLISGKPVHSVRLHDGQFKNVPSEQLLDFYHTPDRSRRIRRFVRPEDFIHFTQPILIQLLRHEM